MTEVSFPFGSSEITTEDQWSSYMRMAQIDGVYATTDTGTDLKVTASNASTVQVAAGEAWIQGTYYSNDAALNVAVPTNSGGGSARNDLVVLRRDPSVDATTVAYKTGGSSYPDLTQTLNGTWEIPLAKVTVAAGASVVSSSGVVDQRWFLGRTVALSNPGARPPATKGQLIVEDKSVYLGNGAGYDLLGIAGSDQGWTTFAVSFVASAGTGAAAPSFRIKDGMVYLRGIANYKFGTFPGGVSTVVATLPAEARPASTRYRLVPTEWVATQSAYLEIAPDGECKVGIPSGSSPSFVSFDGCVYSL